MNHERRLEGKTVLITGAGSGIGRACALRFAVEGADIIINDIHEANARLVESEVKKHGVNARVIIADVTDSNAVQAMVKETYVSFPKLDVLLNNAGVGASISRIVSLPEEKWDRIMNVNLKSVFLVSKYFAKKMAKQDAPDDQLRGKIINIASARGITGRAKFGAYSASKAGVVSITQSLSLELGRYRITVNAIAPGLIHTPIYGNVSYDDLAGTNPTPPALKYKPVGLPGDVAGVAFFLASADSDWITGQCIPVTGGRQFK
ncbi:MAG: SDR family NAD(P)-dependent oxidoreductase [Promethearchaeota archaeon]